MKTSSWMIAVLVGFSVAAAGCGSGDAAVQAAEPSGAVAAAEAKAAPAPTGNVIEVKMFTDDRGNYFEPADITAQRGDVIRFVLASGVHNVSFPAAQNAAASELPAASPYLQLPGQTWDLPVEVGPGEYVFQCDPHAALGMVGTLTVQ